VTIAGTGGSPSQAHVSRELAGHRAPSSPGRLNEGKDQSAKEVTVAFLPQTLSNLPHSTNSFIPWRQHGPFPHLGYK
jgi:hypothetical protein